MNGKLFTVIILLLIILFFFLVISSRNKNVTMHTYKTELWKEMKENSCNIVIDSIKTPFVFISFEDSINGIKTQITFGVDVFIKQTTLKKVSR